MSPRIRRCLEDLYGPSATATAVAEVQVLVYQARARLAERSSFRSGATLSERDAVLITYPDQLREPGEKPLRTLSRFATRHLRGLVSGIHLLPFYPSSSDDGFSVMDYFEVEAAYGGWEDVVTLGADFDLMFDAVFNHASVRGEWFQRFLADDPAYHDFFVTVSGQPDLSRVVRPRALPLLTEFKAASGPRRVWTTFSPDQADLNLKNPAVLLALIEALLFYVAKGARFVRLDAIAFLWKEPGTTCLHLPQTHRVIQLFRAILDEVAPGIRLITETNVPHVENISYFGDGHNEAQLVYNFALPPLVLHSLQTGNAEKLTHWAQSLSLPSDQVTFFNFLASHDGIGLNPARGILTDPEIEAMVQRAIEHGGLVSYKSLPGGAQAPYELNINYLDAVANPAVKAPAMADAQKFLVAQAIMLSLQGVPGIYFHSLFGSRGHPLAAQSTGIKRRINREKLDCATLERELAGASSLRAAIFTGYSDLLRTRRACPALAPNAGQQVIAGDPRVFCVVREAKNGSNRLVCLHNVSPEYVDLAESPLLRDRQSLPPYTYRWVVGE